MPTIIGWDLGGANVKLARVEDGVVIGAVQVPCRMLPERRKFDEAVAAALPRVSSSAVDAVTMTGELSDVFNDRAGGGPYLSDVVARSGTGGRVSGRRRKQRAG